MKAWVGEVTAQVGEVMEQAEPEVEKGAEGGVVGEGRVMEAEERAGEEEMATVEKGVVEAEVSRVGPRVEEWAGAVAGAAKEGTAEVVTEAEAGSRARGLARPSQNRSGCPTGWLWPSGRQIAH